LLKVPAVLELQSDLGGGKTTFVRGLARGLGSQDTVSSPTFTLSKIYKTKSGEIHHFDFYRLDDAGVLKDQLRESLQDPEVVTVIEWSNIVEDVLPDERISIKFQPTSGDSEERGITIMYPENSTELIKKLETDLQGLKP